MSTNMATRADIIRLLQDNPEKRFSAQSISNEIGIPYASVKLIMTDIGIGIETERTETNRMLYYYTTQPRKPLGRYVGPFKPLQLDQGMRDALDRCVADRGGEFHAITIS